jgi:hypothetical protein
MQIASFWLGFEEDLEMLWRPVSLLYQGLNEAFFQEISCDSLCYDFIFSAFLIYLGHFEQNIGILYKIAILVHHVIIRHIAPFHPAP